MKYVFESFILDTDKVALIEGTDQLTLTRKKYEILLMLVTNAGRLLTKSEIIDQIWPDQNIEEGNLTNQIHSLRRLLRDDPRKPHIIITVQGLGYRFQPEVTVVTEADEPQNIPALPVEPPRRPRVKLAVAGLLVLVTIVAMTSWLMRSRSRRSDLPVAPVPIQLTAYPGVEQYPALSPDGSLIAYTWDGGNLHNRDIYIQQTDGSRQVRVTSYPGADRQPVWSPDG